MASRSRPNNLRSDADRMTGETQALLAELKKDNGEAERSRQFIERLAIASEDQDMGADAGKSTPCRPELGQCILRLRKR